VSETLTFSSFVGIAGDMAREAGEGFLPMCANPVARDVRVLKGIEPGEDVSEAARSWALELGHPLFYLAYASHSAVIAEAYENGVLTDSTEIQLTN